MAKLWQVWTLIRLSRELALAGLRRRHPDAGPEELRRHLAALIYGAGTARKVYGPLPREEARQHSTRG